MAVFSVERHGFSTLYSLVSSIGQDLKDCGFYAVKDTISTPLTDAVVSAVLTGPAAPPISGATRSSPTYGYSVTSVTITNSGTKYDPNNPPTVTFSAPAVSNYELIMLDAGYTLFSTNINNDYWNDPDIAGSYEVTVAAADRNNVISRATGTVVVGADGTITGINITNGGYGYSQNETVTVTISNTRTNETKLLLESTALVDPLGLKLNSSNQPLAANQQTGTQPWRINFELRGEAIQPSNTGGALGIYLGTAATLKDDGTVGYVVNNVNITSPTRVEPAGNTGGQWSNGSPISTSLDQCFLNRAGRSDPVIATAYPMSYRLTVTDRGVFLGVWEANTEELGVGFNWLLVQRPVDRLTGETRGGTVATASGRCPVFCLNAVNNKYYKFVVREADLVMPSQRKLANENVEDSTAVINTLNQQSITESGEYVVTFISNLNSPRYKYADELDMIGTVSADVIGAGTEIDVSVYGEAEPRKYKALYPNGAYGTGMRLMVLVSNPNEL